MLGLPCVEDSAVFLMFLLCLVEDAFPMGDMKLRCICVPWLKGTLLDLCPGVFGDSDLCGWVADLWIASPVADAASAYFFFLCPFGYNAFWFVVPCCSGGGLLDVPLMNSCANFGVESLSLGECMGLLEV